MTSSPIAESLLFLSILPLKLAEPRNILENEDMADVVALSVGDVRP
ncbi:MAG: hypothetical protein MZV70_16825 [Desulfobacterales bacterium]|nr:hypothetical protein [Desulfobacterales bacterium]